MAGRSHGSAPSTSEPAGIRRLVTSPWRLTVVLVSQVLVEKRLDVLELAAVADQVGGGLGGIGAGGLLGDQAIKEGKHE